MKEIRLIAFVDRSRFLLTQASLGEKAGGTWNFPLFIDEQEVENNINLKIIESKKIIHEISEKKNIDIFVCDQWTGVPKILTDKIIGIGWFTIEEIFDLEESLNPILAKWLNSFLFYTRH